LVFPAVGIPVRRKGVALATGPVVLVVNHASYLDALFLISKARAAAGDSGAR
jgi:1-acyl-sn-glycerol-3-phosphate acyltransferase